MAAKKSKGLGKGLGALFDDMEVSVPVSPSEVQSKPEDTSTPEKGLLYVDINEIRANSKQPRQNFDEEKLEELADSIKSHGVIQPITIRKAKKGYELVAGERRWRAARKAGLTTIPAILKDITDEENIFMALIENMQREDLNPLEEAEALKEIMTIYALTQNEVASSVGKSRAYVANQLRLLKLPDEVRFYIMEGKLSGGHGKAIGMIQGEEEQIKAAKKAINTGMSVRELERIASDMPESRSNKKPAKKRKNKEIKQIEDELTSLIGAKVLINSTGNKGKMELYYHNEDELNNLIDFLRS